MRKIETLKDVREVADIIMGKVVKGKVAYFNLVVSDSTGFSQAFFSPVTETSKGKNKKMLFVGDYEKLMMLLLSHPKISQVQYDEEENAISAVFDNPFKEEIEDEF